MSSACHIYVLCGYLPESHQQASEDRVTLIAPEFRENRPDSNYHALAVEQWSIRTLPTLGRNLAQYRIPAVGDSVRVSSVPYSVVKVLHGGMASVAIMNRMTDLFADPILLPRLACKMFWAHSITDAQIRNELNVWSSLKHPYIVPLLSLMPVSLRLSALMPVYSQTLGDLIRDQGPLTKDLTRDVLRQLCEAIFAANEQCGCVHLDIKPANVLVSQRGSETQFHLSDWGIASLHGLSIQASLPNKGLSASQVKTYSKWGTLPYMAPERLLGAQGASTVMDIFSLGILAYECITGTLPYVPGAPHDIARQILSGSYLQAISSHTSIDARTTRLLIRMTHPDPSLRIQSSAAAMSELSGLRGGLMRWLR